MNTPIKQMTEMEFEEHLKECFELARKNSWVHVFENVARFDDALYTKHKTIIKVRKELQNIEKTLREI